MTKIQIKVLEKRLLKEMEIIATCRYNLREIAGYAEVATACDDACIRLEDAHLSLEDAIDSLRTMV